MVLYYIENSYRLQFVAQMESAKLAIDTKHAAHLIVLEYAQSRLDTEKEKVALQTTMFCKVTESVIHDIRTPATAIATGIEVLKTNENPQVKEKLLKSIQTAGRAFAGSHPCLMVCHAVDMSLKFTDDLMVGMKSLQVR